MRRVLLLALLMYALPLAAQDEIVNSSTSPAFAAVGAGEIVYLIYQSSADNTLWIARGSYGSNWYLPPKQLPTSVTTTMAPAIVQGPGFSLYIVYRSSAGDNALWTANSPNGWDNPTKLPDCFSPLSPALVHWPPYTGLTAIFKSTYDDTLWMSTSNDGAGRAWQTPTQLPWYITTSASPAAVVWNDRLTIFYKSSADDTIWYARLDPIHKTWSLKQLPAMITTSSPPAVAMRNNNPYIIYRSTVDLSMWMAWPQVDGTWQRAQLPPTATTQSGPAVAVLWDGLHILYRSSTSTRVWHVAPGENPFILPSHIRTSGGDW